MQLSAAYEANDEKEIFKGKRILLAEDNELNAEIAMTILEEAGITIVAMTANAFEEDKKAAFAAGMNWHIAKPIKVDEIMSALTEILKE